MNLETVDQPAKLSQRTLQINKEQGKKFAPTLFMRLATWQRDSHGLFDYESANCDRLQFKTRTAGFIVRKNTPGSEAAILSYEESNTAGALCEITASRSGYFALRPAVQVGDDEDENSQLWRVIHRKPEPSTAPQQQQQNISGMNLSQSPNEDIGYKIKLFDVIKLGRYKFSVKEFSCEQSTMSAEQIKEQELREALPVVSLELTQTENTENDESRVSSAHKESHSNSTNSGQCKYCWGTDSTIENPCIVPCKCSGSVGFIHFKCLKNWLDLKVTPRETGNILSLYWRSFECEICKHAYPYIFRVGDRIYKLVDMKRPEHPNYLVMESLPLERNSSRTVHMLSFSVNQTQFKMGRGHDSEVRVNDISVSRCHSIINYRPNGIYIIDNKSKFGTLVLNRDEKISLNNRDKPQLFQIGRSVCSFTVQLDVIQPRRLTPSQRDNQPTMDEEAELTSSEASMSQNSSKSEQIDEIESQTMLRGVDQDSDVINNLPADLMVWTDGLGRPIVMPVQRRNDNAENQQ